MIFALLLIFILGIFTFLSWKSPKLGITLLFALLPTYLVRFSLFGIPSTLLEGFVLITVGVWIAKNSSVILSATKDLRRFFTSFRMTKAQKTRSSFNLFNISLFLIFIASIISTITAPNTSSALGILKAYFIEPLLLMFIVHSTMTTQKDKEALWNSLIASASFIGLLAILQVLFRIGIPSAWIIENRATSLFPYPNAVGLFLAPIVTFAIVSLAQGVTADLFAEALAKANRPSGNPRSLKEVILRSLAITLMLLGIIAAKTEAALIAIPASLFIITLISPKISKNKKILITIAAITIATLALLSPTILSKLTLHDTSGLVRRSQWKETIAMLTDHPIFGAGLNGYPNALIPYHDATFYEIFQYPHNIFLNVWSELGLLGLIGFIGLILSVAQLAQGVITDRPSSNLRLPNFLPLLAAILTLLIHGLVDVPFFKNDLAILTMFIIFEISKNNED